MLMLVPSQISGHQLTSWQGYYNQAQYLELFPLLEITERNQDYHRNKPDQYNQPDQQYNQPDQQYQSDQPDQRYQPDLVQQEWVQELPTMVTLLPLVLRRSILHPVVLVSLWESAPLFQHRSVT